MIIKNLADTDFKTIISCFNLSFSTYSVALPTEADFWRVRWENAKVDFRYSYGVFDDTKLVAFIINAIDIRNGKLTAYNTGTGVIPSYRGQGLVKKTYDYAIPDLMQNGIEQCTLEVIQDNEIVIKLYKSIGFRITRNYICYNGTLDNVTPHNVQIQKQKPDAKFWETFNQNDYSWDNYKNVVLRSDNNYYSVFETGSFVGSFVINPKTGYISQFDTIQKDVENLTKLFSGIKQVCTTIKINNVLDTLNYKINYLNKIKLNIAVKQHKMRMLI